MKIEYIQYGKFTGNGWTAYLGNPEMFSAFGKTKVEAKENLEKSLKWYFNPDYRTHYPVSKQAKDRVLMLFREFGGFSIHLVNCKTQESYEITCLGEITYKEAIKELDNYVKSYEDQ